MHRCCTFPFALAGLFLLINLYHSCTAFAQVMHHKTRQASKKNRCPLWQNYKTTLRSVSTRNDVMQCHTTNHQHVWIADLIEILVASVQVATQASGDSARTTTVLTLTMTSVLVKCCHLVSAKEVMRHLHLYLSVCWFVSRTAQRVTGGFGWNFQKNLAELRRD